MPGQVETVLPQASATQLAELLQEYGATEDSLRRDAAALREWINAQPHLPKVTAEVDGWLERYLVHSKNSMERAKQRLDAYFSARAAYPEFYSLPPAHEEDDFFSISDFITTTVLPQLTSNGHLVITERYEMPNDFSNCDWERHYRRGVILADVVVAQSAPFRGVELIIDFNHGGMGVVPSLLAGLSSLRRSMHCLQECLPVRVAHVHFVFPPAGSVLKTLLTVVGPFMRDKLQERIKLHDGFETLYEYVPAKYLPKDFGGTLENDQRHYTMKMNEFLRSQRHWIESRKWMQADDTKRIDSKSPINSLGQVEGSFRKLDVD